jgi:hypothetical protein
LPPTSPLSAFSGLATPAANIKRNR